MFYKKKKLILGSIPSNIKIIALEIQGLLNNALEKIRW